jgi:hypothetical protein
MAGSQQSSTLLDRLPVLLTDDLTAPCPTLVGEAPPSAPR